MGFIKCIILWCLKEIIYSQNETLHFCTLEHLANSIVYLPDFTKLAFKFLVTMHRILHKPCTILKFISLRNLINSLKWH